MASPVYYHDQRVQMNNRHFFNFLEFSLEVAEKLDRTDAETEEYERIKNMKDEGHFWPGRGLVIEDDFDEPEALQFWTRVSFETAQSVFLREVGSQDNTAWQSQMIYFAYAVGQLFLAAFRDAGGDKRWFPETRASAEFRRVLAQGAKS